MEEDEKDMGQAGSWTWGAVEVKGGAVEVQSVEGIQSAGETRH